MSLNVAKDEGMEKTSRPPFQLPFHNTQGNAEEPQKSLDTHSHLGFCWRYELAACFASIATLTAILVILANYNNQPQPDWPYSITINSIIAILVTLLKALMVFAVAEVIGQQKWLWFRKSRPFSDMDTFDRATRGIYGALQLLFKTQHHSVLSCVGSLVIILAVLSDPFAQQALKYYSCPQIMSDTIAKTPRAVGYGVIHPGPVSQSALPYLEPSMRAALYDGLCRPSSNFTRVTSDCVTGNCTFPIYSSLGICTSCTNEAYNVKYNCSQSGRFLNIQGIWEQRQWCTLSLGSDEISFNHTQARTVPVAHEDGSRGFVFLAGTGANCSASWMNGGERSDNDCVQLDAFPGKAVAATCLYSVCVKSYNGSVTRGTLHEKTASEKTRLVYPAELPATNNFGYDYYNIAPKYNFYLPDPCYIKGKPYKFDEYINGRETLGPYKSVNLTLDSNGKTTEVPKECVYHISLDTINILNEYLGSFFKAEATGPAAYSTSNWGVGFDPGWLQVPWHNGKADFKSVVSVALSAGDSMTAEIRQSGNKSDFAQGVTSTDATCVRVDWLWLIYLIALTVFSSGFLIAAIVNNARHPEIQPWKSDILGYFYQPLDFDTQEDLHANNKGDGSIGALRKNARDIKVRLVPEACSKNRSWHLQMGTNQSSEYQVEREFTFLPKASG